MEEFVSIMKEIVMTEEVKSKLMFFLSFLIPIFLYVYIGKILGKSFNKAPDNPLFPEKKKKNPLVRVLKFLVIIAIAIVLITARNRVSLNVILNVLEDNEAREEAIIAEYEALHEDNVDPENGKLILTQAYLRKEYKMYAANKVGWANFSTTLYKVIFISLLITAGGLSCIEYAIEFVLQKKKISILSILASLLLIPTIIFTFKAIDKDSGPGVLPDPENAKVFVSTVMISSRREVEHYDQDSDSSSYKYYITIDYGDGNGPVSQKVDFSMYDTAEKPGTYLMGQAEENGNKCDFELFSLEEYEEDRGGQ